MSIGKKKGIIAFVLIILLLVIDQVIKLAVKMNMCLGESIHIFDWFQLVFVENNGMAWGMEIGSKLFLSIFRLIAVAVLIYYICKRIEAGARTGYIVVLSMICAGAAGNIFDSLVYGQIFTASEPYYVPGATPATLVPWGSGYAPVLMGKVVDMFYFPLFKGVFPSWFPIWGGEHFVFFSPVFNFADSCISVGVVLLFIFFRKDFNGWTPTSSATNPSEVAANSAADRASSGISSTSSSQREATNSTDKKATNE